MAGYGSGGYNYGQFAVNINDVNTGGSAASINTMSRLAESGMTSPLRQAISDLKDRNRQEEIDRLAKERQSTLDGRATTLFDQGQAELKKGLAQIQIEKDAKKFYTTNLFNNDSQGFSSAVADGVTKTYGASPKGNIWLDGDGTETQKAILGGFEHYTNDAQNNFTLAERAKAVAAKFPTSEFAMDMALNSQTNVLGVEAQRAKDKQALTLEIAKQTGNLASLKAAYGNGTTSSKSSLKNVGADAMDKLNLNVAKILTKTPRKGVTPYNDEQRTAVNDYVATAVSQGIPPGKIEATVRNGLVSGKDGSWFFNVGSTKGAFNPLVNMDPVAQEAYKASQGTYDYAATTGGDTLSTNKLKLTTADNDLKFLKKRLAAMDEPLSFGRTSKDVQASAQTYLDSLGIKPSGTVATGVNKGAAGSGNTKVPFNANGAPGISADMNSGESGLLAKRYADNPTKFNQELTKMTTEQQKEVLKYVPKYVTPEVTKKSASIEKLKKTPAKPKDTTEEFNFSSVENTNKAYLQEDGTYKYKSHGVIRSVPSYNSLPTNLKSKSTKSVNPQNDVGPDLLNRFFETIRNSATTAGRKFNTDSFGDEYAVKLAYARANNLFIPGSSAIKDFDTESAKYKAFKKKFNSEK